jgi:hypothetical protein
VAKAKAPVNPFYVLVVVFGVVFVITACAYGTMAYRAIAPAVDAQSRSQGLMGFLDRFGVQSLSIELVVLGVASFLAMWLDQIRSRREAANSGRSTAITGATTEADPGRKIS